MDTDGPGIGRRMAMARAARAGAMAGLASAVPIGPDAPTPIVRVAPVGTGADGLAAGRAVPATTVRVRAIAHRHRPARRSTGPRAVRRKAARRAATPRARPRASAPATAAPTSASPDPPENRGQSRFSLMDR